ncbi:MAG: hypothetical protein U0822_25475 [Anaerolineae bacterium]
MRWIEAGVGVVASQAFANHPNILSSSDEPHP